MCDSKKLIEAVENHPILYDSSHSDYKNVKKKNKLWNILAKSFDDDGEELRKKWKNLRDSYSKHLRYESSGRKVKALDKYRSWPWAEQMEFIRPFIQSGNTDVIASVKGENSDKPETPPPIKKKKSAGKSLNEMVNYFENIQNTVGSDLDDIDLICMGYAKTIKRFSAKRQTMIKFRFSQILMQEELAQQAEDERCGSSTLTSADLKEDL